MPEVDPHMAEILRLINGLDLPPYEGMSGAEARAAAEERNVFWNEGNPEVARVRDLSIPGPAGPMCVRLYEPAGVGATSPGILYIHGGGWVICSLDTHDGVCRRLANAAGLRVASLDYRMAPEHPFPAPLDDCVAAASWLMERGTELGINPERLALAGDSAGGNLSLATLLALRDRSQPLPQTAALIYGAFSADLDSPSHQAYGGGEYVLSTPTMHGSGTITSLTARSAISPWCHRSRPICAACLHSMSRPPSSTPCGMTVSGWPPGWRSPESTSTTACGGASATPAS